MEPKASSRKTLGRCVHQEVEPGITASLHHARCRTQVVLDTILNGQAIPGRTKSMHVQESARTGFGLRALSTGCWRSSPGLLRQSGDSLCSDRTERVGRQWSMLEPSLRCG